MCAGDLALEKAVMIDGKLDRSVDGWGVTHECRDWSSMYDIAVKESMIPQAAEQ